MPGVSPKFSLAVAQHKAGNYRQAESIYRQLLAGDPRDPNPADALHLLGLIASESGQHEAAAALIVKAIHLRGPEPVYCSNLGVALSRQGKQDEAIACYRQALRGRPGDAKTHACLGRSPKPFVTAPAWPLTPLIPISIWGTPCTLRDSTKKPRKAISAPSRAVPTTPKLPITWA